MTTTPGNRVRATPRAAVALLTTLVVTGCASASGGQAAESGAPLSATAPAELTPSNVLTGDQLRRTDTSNLWDALRRLRPQWLRARADISLASGDDGGEPVVYLHGIRHGELRTLQQMNIDQVRRVEFIDGRDATTRFGTGHGGGVIMVDLNRE